MSERNLAGVLMPLASLPSAHGIGDMGPASYQFIDILSQMQVKLWQVLPLNPLGYGNSPYQPYSSFAGEELYLSLELLYNDGLLPAQALNEFNRQASFIDYPAVRAFKQQWLTQAFANFQQQQVSFTHEYTAFVAANGWLENYAVFMALRTANQQRLWTQWPRQHKEWPKTREQRVLTDLRNEIEYHYFIQFMFYRQWRQLKEYANAHTIAIMGDIPIYLGLDSAEVWANQDLFLLDNEGNPTFVAGVPPDFFAANGQRWGNPLYNWQKLQATDFTFWVERLRGNLQAFDIIRIDHFRAFDSYWQIKAECPTAVDGQWLEAPGYALLDRIFSELPSIQLVVEDLGDLRPQVLELRDHYQLTGMSVMQWCLNLNGDNDTWRTLQNTIIYSGTHDNDTLIGWYQSLSKRQRQRLHKLLNDKEQLVPALINYLLAAAAKYVILPLADILELGRSARINQPGTVGAPNWQWRLTEFSGLRSKIEFMRQAISAAQR